MHVLQPVRRIGEARRPEGAGSLGHVARHRGEQDPVLKETDREQLGQRQRGIERQDGEQENASVSSSIVVSHETARDCVEYSTAQPCNRSLMPRTSLRRLRNALVLIVAIYFVGGSISQKMLPGVDEIFPLFGWSLFTKVPNIDQRYEVIIHRHDRRPVEPPVPFLQAPPTMVQGSPHLARKLIQGIGDAFDSSDLELVEQRRRLFERTYLRGRVIYELVYESYDPYDKWRTGENLESRSLQVFNNRPDR